MVSFVLSSQSHWVLQKCRLNVIQTACSTNITIKAQFITLLHYIYFWRQFFNPFFNRNIIFSGQCKKQNKKTYGTEVILVYPFMYCYLLYLALPWDLHFIEGRCCYRKCFVYTIDYCLFCGLVFSAFKRYIARPLYVSCSY